MEGMIMTGTVSNKRKCYGSSVDIMISKEDLKVVLINFAFGTNQRQILYLRKGVMEKSEVS